MSADVVSLAAAWVRHWTDRPNDPVLVDDQGRTLVGRQVNEMTAQRASDLAASGIDRGSRVLLSCAPSIDLALTYIALMRLGITVLPANTGYTERELEHLRVAGRHALRTAAKGDERRRSRDLWRRQCELVDGCWWWRCLHRQPRSSRRTISSRAEIGRAHV